MKFTRDHMGIFRPFILECPEQGSFSETGIMKFF